MKWTEELQLGLAPMDAVHQEFIELYNELAAADESAFIDAMDRFIEHTEAHFAMENGWMAATNFPGCHKAEHDRVLIVMHDIRNRAAAGDRTLGRRLVEELPAWFENHATGMDAALAYYLEEISSTRRPAPPWPTRLSERVVAAAVPRPKRLSASVRAASVGCECARTAQVRGRL